jgi:hypothetical protein
MIATVDTQKQTKVRNANVVAIAIITVMTAVHKPV